MASSMLPPARPFRLNVHVLPAEASNNLQIEPTRRFLQITPRTKTLQQFCDDISLRHQRQYGSPLDIKKCQVVSGSDLDLEYQLGDVFDDHDVIRVIEAPVKGVFAREDSLFPESSLRPKNTNRSKRARSNSVRPNSRDPHTDEYVPNKRQRVLDPDHPVRSLERDLEDDETTLVNGDISPVVQVADSQQLGATAQDQGHVNGIRDSTPNNNINLASQSSLGSPFNLLYAAKASPQLPSSRRVRSGSESSFHHRDDILARNITDPQQKPNFQRYSLPNQTNQNVIARGNSVSTAATTPPPPVIPNTPDRSNTSKRLGSGTGRSVSLGRKSSEASARVDVYDDIETDTEAPPRINPPKASSSARKVRENRAREEAEEKRRLLEIEKLAQRKREEQEAAKREEEAEAAAQREQDAAEAKRHNEELLAEQQRKAQRIAEEERIKLERKRQEEAHGEDEKQRQAEKAREAEENAEKQRLKEQEKARKRTEKAAQTAREEAKKVAKAAKEAEKERSMTESTPDSQSSRSFSEILANSAENLPGLDSAEFPPCPVKVVKGVKGIWTAELDNVLIEARKKGQDWADIRKEHFPTIEKNSMIQRRHRSVMEFRAKHLEKLRGKKPQTSTQAKSSTTPVISSSKVARESSTAPIPSNGTVLSNLHVAASSQAVASSSPRQDVGINSQVPLSAKARRSVSFASEAVIPTSGQKPASRSAAKTSVPGTASKKETPIPTPKPIVFSSTPDAGSLKQTKLVSPRLGITDVKPTAKAVTTGNRTPSKLKAKQAIKPQRTYSAKKQAKLLPDASIPDEKHSEADLGSHTEDREKEGLETSQHKLTSTADDSDDEGLNDESGKAQRLAEKKTAANARQPLTAERNEEVDAQERESRSSSREQSPVRDSRSPVAFMSKQASPLASETKSQDREDSLEIPQSDISSSPPILPDDKGSNMEVDDQSTESEEDDLDKMEVDEPLTNKELPIVNPTSEQEMDDLLQSQIRRDSSQRESRSVSSQHMNSKTQTPGLKGRPSHSSQFPSLAAMSQVQKERPFSSGSHDKSKSKAAEQTRFEESETDSEEDSEEESDDSGSSSDADPDQGKTARTAGTDLGSKAGRKKEVSLYDSVIKQISRKK